MDARSVPVEGGDGKASRRAIISFSQYSVPPLLAAIDFHIRNGRWPLPGEPR